MPPATSLTILVSTTVSTIILDRFPSEFSTTAAPPITPDHPYIAFARKIYIWLVPVMAFTLFLAAIGNGLIVLSSFFFDRKLSPYCRLCVSLALSDAWAASLMITGLIVNSYMPIVLRIQKKSNCINMTLEIFRIAGMLTSNIHIWALALTQFIGIAYPIKYKTLLTTRRLRTSIFILWIAPIFFVSFWFFFTPGDGFQSPQCTQNFYNRFPFRLSIFVAFIVPLLGTFIFYGCIVRSLIFAKANSEYDMRCFRRSTRDSYRKKIKSRIKLMYTTLLILLSFVFSWGGCVLYFVLVCIEGCAWTYLQTIDFHTGFLMNSIVNFLVMLKLLGNPLIYALRLSHIRTGILNLRRIFFLLLLKRKPLKEEREIPTLERRSTRSFGVFRKNSYQSSPQIRLRSRSVTRRSFEEPSRVFADLIQLVEIDYSTKSSGLETSSRLALNELSPCPSISSVE